MSEKRGTASPFSRGSVDGEGRLRLITKIADVESEGEILEGMPIGNSNFRKLRDRDLYFVDKSLLIDEVLRSTADVMLITRPRRFGKSLNLSMLDSYLNMKYADGCDYFSDLKISEKRPDDPEKNTNPVISISLKDLGNGTYESFLKEFEKKAGRLYRDFLDLYDSPRLDPATREDYRRIYEKRSTEYNLSTCICDLCLMLEMHYGKKAIILIDEYDNAMNYAYGNPKEHEQIVGFMRTLLGSALKDNDSLRFAVITGVMRISKESIFSGLNNLCVVDVFSTRYDELYGFTQAEVEALLTDCGHSDMISEVKEWYDGYRFGNADVYNPWSVINYVNEGCRPDTYWANTSSNSIIGDLLRMADGSRWKELETLCAGGSVEVGANSKVAYCDLEYTDDAIYSILVASGYLKAVPMRSGYAVSIPNKEVFRIFAETVLLRFGANTDMVLSNLIDAMVSGDAEQMSIHLERLMEILSIRILKDEYVYEAFIAGLMASMAGTFEVEADHEAGNGYFDVRLRRISGSWPNIIIEVKRRNGKNIGMTMDELALDALEQIRDRGYAMGLQGETILYGIAFDGKVPTIAMDRTDETRPSVG